MMSHLEKLQQIKEESTIDVLQKIHKELLEVNTSGQKNQANINNIANTLNNVATLEGQNGIKKALLYKELRAFVAGIIITIFAFILMAAVSKAPTSYSEATVNVCSDGKPAKISSNN